MKKILLSIIALVAVLSANAQNTLYIGVGNTTDIKRIPVTIYMDNSNSIYALQASYALPAGLTYKAFNQDSTYSADDEEWSFFYVALSGRAYSAHKTNKKEMFTASKPNDLLISITDGGSATPKYFKESTGAIGSFSFDGSSLADGTYYVKQYTATLFPDANTRYDQTDTEAGFTISKGVVTVINSVKDDAKNTNGTIYNIAGQRMNSFQKGINIVDGKKYLVK